MNQRFISGQRSHKVFLLRLSLFLCVIIFLCFALSIPFAYETQTLWYKVGFNKTLLFSGQLFGILAFFGIFSQVVVGLRGKTLETIFPVSSLVSYHKKNGLVIVLLAVFHVVCVLLPEGLNNLPIGVKYWPEMIGGLLLLAVLVTSFLAFFRQKIHLPYLFWKRLHQVLGYLIVIMLPVHILFVSESFTFMIPKLFLLLTMMVLVLHVVIVKLSK